MSVDFPSKKSITFIFFSMPVWFCGWECISTLEKAISYACGSTLLAGIGSKCTSGMKVCLIVMGMAVRWWFNG